MVLRYNVNVVLENISFQYCERPLVTKQVAIGDI